MVGLQERFQIIEGTVISVEEWKLKAEKLKLKVQVLPWEKLAFEKHNLQKLFSFNFHYFRALRKEGM